MSPPRSISAFLADLANAVRPDGPTTATINPSDCKAIGKLMQVAEWLKTDERARKAFEAHQRSEHANR